MTHTAGTEKNEWNHAKDRPLRPSRVCENAPSVPGYQPRFNFGIGCTCGNPLVGLGVQLRGGRAVMLSQSLAPAAGRHELLSQSTGAGLVCHRQSGCAQRDRAGEQP
jgi:hypothetical protein